MLLNVPATKTRSPTGWIASTRGTPCEALVVVAGPIPHVRAGAAVTAASAAGSATSPPVRPTMATVTTLTTLRCHLGTIALPFHPTTRSPRGPCSPLRRRHRPRPSSFVRNRLIRPYAFGRTLATLGPTSPAVGLAGPEPSPVRRRPTVPTCTPWCPRAHPRPGRRIVPCHPVPGCPPASRSIPTSPTAQPVP